MRTNRLGEKHITNEGYEVEIIEWYGVKKCSVRFSCGFILTNLQYGAVKDGRIKYPFHPSVFNVGFFGVGRFFQKRKGVRCNNYNTWKNMIERCYSEKRFHKNKTYKDVVVCEEWKCFQNFAEWVEQNYNPETMQGWHLDKDILVKGNKVYSPETCAFVPAEINSLFTKSDAKRGEYPIGVIKHKKVFRVRINKNKKFEHIGLYNTPKEAFQAYKEAKENYIKEVADRWKGLILDKVYQAMYNHKVEITD